MALLQEKPLEIEDGFLQDLILSYDFEVFIKYTELSEPTLEGRIVRYQALLRDIAIASKMRGCDLFEAWNEAQIKPVSKPAAL